MKLKLTIVVAMDSNQVIGLQGSLPWKIPEDLKRFKAITLGKSLLLGRKTLESLPNQTLPGRKLFVLSKTPTLFKNSPNTTWCNSFMDACRIIEESDVLTAYVIGGGMIYQEALPYTQCLEITQIHSTFQGDTYFPKLSPQEWKIIKRIEIAEQGNTPALSFITMVRA
ncbi:MAG: dihydrofolate reductase [Methylacidiphilales bacterium]|nr:dihydrofolate reductase [Candidatus Methylacidiphilales bacterium]